MKRIKVAINGFGRIGRVFTRCLINSNNKHIELVAINDLVDAPTLAHLLKYDSVHGVLNNDVSCTSNSIVIDGKEIKVLNERNPENLPWSYNAIDIVVESTGFFRDKLGAEKHIKAGAKKVIISAPSVGSDVKTVVLGVNDAVLDGSETVLSNASCTTNCAAPMIKIINDNFRIKSGYITTTHAYTGDQNIHDAPHKDLRRARAAAKSIIPTTTGAAKAISKIFPELEGKLVGSGIRVPVLNGSLTDVICQVEKVPTVKEVNALFFKASNEGEMSSILSYTSDPIVSNDIVGNKYSCIIDSDLTSVNDNTIRIIGWYDNEAGYSNRIMDLINKIA
jgi:glyceraldehyde 3-phosphate dehydrogenase